MKKILLILILLLCGCDDKNTLYDKTTIGGTHWRTCIDGKEFIIGCNRLSINLDFDGKPIPCEENK